MTDGFSQILNMSLTGAVVILFVLAARLVLKNVPKIFSYALWSVVLFRLLCPVSIPAPVSVLEVAGPEVTQSQGITSSVSYIPANYVRVEPAAVAAAAQPQQASSQKPFSMMEVLSSVWLAGIAVMASYSILTYVRLRRNLIGAVCYRDNVYLADHIASPFVLGVLRPKIYLPSDTPAGERRFIMAHERHHIRRGDHIIKLLAYAALCLHWFNPLVWLSFILAGKDMEMSCDEAVIKKLGPQIRADYSASLLRLATHRSIIAGTPLAFGEGDTKGRVMNMAKWKKPKLWVSILAVVLCIAVFVACAVNPQEKETAALEEKNTNIVIVALNPAKETPTGDSVLLLTLNSAENTAAIHSFLDTTVSMPDYQGHVSGDHPFSVCYSLGFAIGNGTAGAMEYTNLCLKENYGIDVDYNVAISTEELSALINGLGGVTVEVTAEDVADFESSDVAQLRDAQPGPLELDGNTAVAYAAVLHSGETAEEELRRTNRQRMLFSALIPELGIRKTQELLPALYASDALDGEPADWTDILKQLGNAKTLSVGTIPTEIPAEESAEKPVISGSNIATNIELVQYGVLTMALPEGYTCREENGSIILTRDDADVGGITCWAAPDFELIHVSKTSPESANMAEWIRALGLPEAQESDEPIAYMISNSLYGDLEAEYFNELHPEKLNVEHHFFIDGDLVYDVYYDQNNVSDSQAEKFLKTIAVSGEPVVTPEPSEEESLTKCRNVLSLIQSGSFCIASDRENQGTIALNDYSYSKYWQHNGNWLSITEIPESGGSSFFYYMEVDGVHYNTERTGWDENGPIWAEGLTVTEVGKPWLATFRWNDETVAYLDTVISGGEECVMLRIDEPYPYGSDNSESYFVNFYFANGGAFLRADVQVNLFMDNAFRIKETIVTLDAQTVAAEIEAQYTRARETE